MKMRMYAAAFAMLALEIDATAQSYAVGWGPQGFDTRSSGNNFVQVRTHLRLGFASPETQPCMLTA